MSNLYKKSDLDRDSTEHKITQNQNWWKFEFTLLLKGWKYIRLKFYDKTAELLASLGVMNFLLGDPLSKLLLT